MEEDTYRAAEHPSYLEGEDDDSYSIESEDNYHGPPNDVHTFLRMALKIEEDDYFAFGTLLGLVDPRTQPQESDDYVLSIETITDVYTGLLFLEHRDTSRIGKYETLVQLFKLLMILMQKLGPVEQAEIDLAGAAYDDNWELRLDMWAPPGFFRADHFLLKLCYLLSVILINTLRKLFVDDDGNFNLALNPYTYKFVELWKVYSKIILIALQIDRRLEEEETDTPYIIIEILKGASLVRYILAYTLNHSLEANPTPEINVMDEEYVEDLNNISLLDLHYPLSRKKMNGGALARSLHFLALSDFFINSPVSSEYYEDLKDISPINDKYDEDIRYIFDYEADDDDDEDENEDDFREGLLDGAIGKNAEVNYQMDGEFWEDFQEIISHLEEHFYKLLLWEKDEEGFNKLAQNILLTICFKERADVDVVDLLFSKQVDESLVNYFVGQNLVTPVLNVTLFELLLVSRFDFAVQLFGQLLMLSKKERHVCLFTLCNNVNLSRFLIDHVYQLLIEKPFSGKWIFSRGGDRVYLRKAEKMILIHAFIQGALEFLAASSGIDTNEGYGIVLSQTVCNKLVKLICLMFNNLLDQDIINKDSDVTLPVIFMFLIDYIGSVPDARDLYFRVRKLNEQKTQPIDDLISQGLKVLELKDDFQGAEDNCSKFEDLLKKSVKTLLDFMNTGKADDGIHTLLVVQLYFRKFPLLSSLDDFLQNLMIGMPIDAHTDDIRMKNEKAFKLLEETSNARYQPPEEDEEDLDLSGHAEEPSSKRKKKKKKKKAKK